MPGPWSRTTSSPSRTVDLDLAARRAPLRGVVEQVRRPRARSSRDAAHERLLELGSERRRRAGCAACARSPRRRRGRAARPPARCGWLVAARELDELGDERGHLVELLADVARAAARARPAAARRSRASTSMFVRRLVSGVRSSCDASATSCRCARAESSSAASIVLKLAARRRARRGRARRCAARGRRVSVDLLGRLGQPAHRRERGARRRRGRARRRRRSRRRRSRNRQQPDPRQRRGRPRRASARPAPRSPARRSTAKPSGRAGASRVERCASVKNAPPPPRATVAHARRSTGSAPSRRPADGTSPSGVDDLDVASATPKLARDVEVRPPIVAECGGRRGAASARGSRSASSTWPRSCPRTTNVDDADASDDRERDGAAADERQPGRGSSLARAARSRRRASCGSAAACRPPPSCAADSRCRRRASSSRSRSRSPRRARR